MFQKILTFAEIFITDMLSQSVREKLHNPGFFSVQYIYWYFENKYFFLYFLSIFDKILSSFFHEYCYNLTYISYVIIFFII